ncbi:uncharacterized protein LOC117169991 [Belonocnema kinseyi]|uniref:uncharacterized protein LOC117169991 n=1 Tax=Belonocnema kinseyi TaxID=2817044 RepID=UPI00143CFD30|nr:uncharacterized protein LOC117169991 [Belonocnema kinseyi]
MRLRIYPKSFTDSTNGMLRPSIKTGNWPGKVKPKVISIFVIVAMLKLVTKFRVSMSMYPPVDNSPLKVPTAYAPLPSLPQASSSLAAQNVNKHKLVRLQHNLEGCTPAYNEEKKLYSFQYGEKVHKIANTLTEEHQLIVSMLTANLDIYRNNGNGVGIKVATHTGRKFKTPKGKYFSGSEFKPKAEDFIADGGHPFGYVDHMRNLQLFVWETPATHAAPDAHAVPDAKKNLAHYLTPSAPPYGHS